MNEKKTEIELKASSLGKYFIHPCDRFLYCASKKVSNNSRDNDREEKKTKHEKNVRHEENGSIIYKPVTEVDEAGNVWEEIVNDQIRNRFNCFKSLALPETEMELLKTLKDNNILDNGFLIQTSFQQKDEGLENLNVSWGTAKPDLIYVYKKDGKTHLLVGDIKLRSSMAWEFKIQIAAYIRLLKQRFNGTGIVVDDDRAFIICAEKETYDGDNKRFQVDGKKLKALEEKLNAFTNNGVDKKAAICFDPSPFLTFLDEFIRDRLTRISNKITECKENSKIENSLNCIYSVGCEDCEYYGNEKDNCIKRAKKKNPVLLLPYLSPRGQRYAIDNMFPLGKNKDNKDKEKSEDEYFEISNWFSPKKEDVQPKISSSATWREFQFNHYPKLCALEDFLKGEKGNIFYSTNECYKKSNTSENINFSASIPVNQDVAMFITLHGIAEDGLKICAYGIMLKGKDQKLLGYNYLVSEIMDNGSFEDISGDFIDCLYDKLKDCGKENCNECKESDRCDEKECGNKRLQIFILDDNELRLLYSLLFHNLEKEDYGKKSYDILRWIQGDSRVISKVSPSEVRQDVICNITREMRRVFVLPAILNYNLKDMSELIGLKLKRDKFCKRFSYSIDFNNVKCEDDIDIVLEHMEERINCECEIIKNIQEKKKDVLFREPDKFIANDKDAEMTDIAKLYVQSLYESMIESTDERNKRMYDLDTMLRKGTVFKLQLYSDKEGNIKTYDSLDQFDHFPKGYYIVETKKDNKRNDADEKELTPKKLGILVGSKDPEDGDFIDYLKTLLTMKNENTEELKFNLKNPYTGLSWYVFYPDEIIEFRKKTFTDKTNDKNVLAMWVRTTDGNVVMFGIKEKDSGVSVIKKGPNKIELYGFDVKNDYRNKTRTGLSELLQEEKSCLPGYDYEINNSNYWKTGKTIGVNEITCELKGQGKKTDFTRSQKKHINNYMKTK